ncbi:MAG: biotin--[acetyl-CoA-carboxylase] ligase [Candidatus Latescibacteria bacterium]|jgi:BirA family biotin operon repressor/biotin-[acetyl-CoA-carboxylase] ligase|nr:biotin--[acetyl-CoA-carboxylase] ligase [Candidatus Latescibacterota bacterium]
MNFQKPEWHPQLPSTNTTLLNRLSSGDPLPSGFVLATHEQTSGRGRYQRNWIAQAHQNLTFSFLLITRSDFPKLASLPMAIALGVSDALKTYDIESQTKWPNDILIDSAKICGMLLERSECKHPNGTAIIIGIGLNVNMDATTAALINRPVTSMCLETGQEYDLENVLTQILTTTAPWIDLWENRGFAGLRTHWEQRCAYLGEQISVGEGKDIKTGILIGFGTHGQLLLKDNSGQQHEIWAGDVAAI